MEGEMMDKGDKMNIELESLIEVLALYNFTERISDFNFLINYYNEKTIEMKVITKVKFLDRKALVVKFIKENKHPNNIIENQSIFSEYLRSQGILTAKRYMSGERYCIKYKWNNMLLDVTIEDYLGEEIKAIDSKLAYKIGQLMARMHKISEKGNCHIGANTIFNIAGYNEVSGFDSFLELGISKKIDLIMYKKIETLYIAKLDRVKSLWDKLPKYAVQGDISINNLSFIGDEIGIFDYNNAGDETLVGDMMLEGLLTANEMELTKELTKELTDEDRTELFKSFFQGYTSERPLTDAEKNVLSDIYSISSALWFTKIEHSVNSLTKLVEHNEYYKVDSLLQDIYNSLCTDRFNELE